MWIFGGLVKELRNLVEIRVISEPESTMMICLFPSIMVSIAVALAPKKVHPGGLARNLVSLKMFEDLSWFSKFSNPPRLDNPPCVELF